MSEFRFDQFTLLAILPGPSAENQTATKTSQAQDRFFEGKNPS